jgi:hypothetical protein
VGNINGSNAQAEQNAVELNSQDFAQLGVQCREGLIEQAKSRLNCNRAGKGDALILTT